MNYKDKVEAHWKNASLASKIEFLSVYYPELWSIISYDMKLTFYEM